MDNDRLEMGKTGLETHLEDRLMQVEEVRDLTVRLTMEETSERLIVTLIISQQQRKRRPYGVR